MFRRMSWITVMLLFAIVTTAQESCDAIVQTAIDTAAENCDGLRRNEACYGNVTIDAEAAPDVDEFAFDTAGDIVNVSDIASMRLSSQVEDSGEWGISIMQVPVITDDGTENAQFVLFGDVEITNASTTQEVVEPVTIELTATGNLNVRGGPSTSNAVVGSLSGGQVITAIGRNDAGDWVQFVQEDGSMGWVFVSLMRTEGDVLTLSIATDETVSPPIEEESSFAEVTAFQIRVGSEDRPCEQAPDSGLLIQTPQGAGNLTINLNQVQIELGSTVYVQFLDNSQMAINLLEGQAFVTADAQISRVLEGSRVRVPLDANFAANGAPSPSEPYANLGNLPLSLLNDVIGLAEPSNPARITSQFGSAVMDFAASVGGVEGSTLEDRGWFQDQDMCTTGSHIFTVTGQFAIYVNVTAGTTLTVTNNISSLEGAPFSVLMSQGGREERTTANTLTYTAQSDGNMLIQAAPDFGAQQTSSLPLRQVRVVCGR